MIRPNYMGLGLLSEWEGWGIGGRGWRHGGGLLLQADGGRGIRATELECWVLFPCWFNDDIFSGPIPAGRSARSRGVLWPFMSGPDGAEGCVGGGADSGY